MRQPIRRRLLRRLYEATRVSPQRQSYERHKSAARAHIVTLVQEYATRYDFALKRIAIRDTKRRWGSCSALGHLNFSYKLLFLPPCQVRYIVVHELCHLRELNHSARYWAHVAELMPDYTLRIAALREVERTAGTSVKALTAWQQRHDTVSCVHCQYDTSVRAGEVVQS